MSGTITSVSSVSNTGDARIDGLFSGKKWGVSTISYSNPDSALDYQAGYFLDANGNGTNAIYESFAQIGAQQLATLQFALDTTRYGTFSPGGAGFPLRGLQISQ